MNRKALLVGAGLLGLVGCNKTAGSYRGAAGSLASSQDGALIYAVDTDNQQVIVANASDGSKVTTINVGANPSRILVGLDDKIYVTNRGERTVSVISKSNFQEVSRIAVGVEPVGLGMSDDGKELYVISSTDLNDPTHGTLTAIDTTSLKATWSTAVGEEPRGVAVANGKAYVSNFKAGTVSVVDLSKQALVTSVNLNNQDDPSAGSSASVGLVADVTAAPDGTRVYAPHVWQRNNAISLSVGTPGGYYQTGGPCGVGAIVSPGISTVQTSDDTNLVDSFTTCGASGGVQSTNENYPPSVIFPDRTSGTPANVFQAPSVAVVDPTNSWLFVANRDSNNIVVFPTNSRVPNTSPSQTNVSAEIELTDATISGGGVPDNRIGVAPDGLLISKDGKTLYAYSQFGHTLSLIRQTDSSNALSLGVVSQVQLATDPASLTSDLAVGRQIFFSAVDQRVSGVNTGISCASCHANGLEDGHTWQFPDGPRRTPVLAGRDLAATAPYHWTGVFPTIADFMAETLIKRMGGTGLTTPGTPTQDDPNPQLATPDGQRLIAYMESLKPADNPLQNRPDLQNVLAEGQAAFHQAACDTCHTGAAMTNNQTANVGTITGADLLENTEDPTQLDALTTGFNVPSLLGIGRSAPYLHDGSIVSLSQRVAEAVQPGSLHGNASSLTSDQQSALVTYLSSL